MNDITIQTNSDVPIYRQLINQVHRLVTAGRLTPGERLPSVRQLAEALAVNPMTVSKAYNLLEQEGLLERRRGVGMVVKEDSRTAGELLAPAIETLVQQSIQLRVDRDSLNEMLDSAWNREKEQKGKEKP